MIRALAGASLLLMAAAERERDGGGYTHPEMLVETSELAAAAATDRVRIIDTRNAKAYAEGHIKGAVHFDGAPFKATDTKPAALPPPRQVEQVLGALGIDNDARVVIYDDGRPSAARLWYVLDYHGHRHVALLNGGWKKWTAEGRPVTKEVFRASGAVFVARPRAGAACTAVQLKARINKPGTVILDVRTPAEYAGAGSDAGKAGHVPGAVNLEWSNSLTTDGTFKTAAELRKLFGRAGVTPDKEVVTYCKTGGRASHTLFVLRLIGYENAVNYYGSWQDWSGRMSQMKAR